MHQQQGINLQVARVQEKETSGMVRIRDERPENQLLKSVASPSGRDQETWNARSV